MPMLNIKRSSTKRVYLLLTFFIATELLSTPCSAAEKNDPETFINSINMKFIRVPSGIFFMGSQEHEEGSTKEKPRHRVHITEPFYLGQYEVTQKQWSAVMGKMHPSNFPSPDRPVDEVSWNDVQAFIQKLNEIEKEHSYRLPTEAEWEYAARAGSETPYCFGNDLDRTLLKQYAWYELNSDKQSHPVGSLQANAWGFYDMHGNVAEWVQDLYDKNYYARSPEENPVGPLTGKKRVSRGGSWINQAYSCRSAFRGYFSADYTDSDFGFRIVKTID